MIIKFKNLKMSFWLSFAKFNNIHFPGYDFKYKINQGNFDEKKFSIEKEREFLPVYQKLLKKYAIKLKQDKSDSFLDVWFMDNVRREIDSRLSDNQTRKRC